ncbi:MAG: hypothetical protein KGK10_09565 [Rhodospirillales bacterium]|nr:hypothetical protein [Rhodospirillales bacterium]
MIRPITLLACLAAAGSGLYLYQTKLSAQLLDQRITRTVHEIRTVRQRTALLTAEYALLNDPQRLQQLSDQFLQLPPTAPSQYVTMADLAARLPPVGPPPTAPAAPQDAPPAVSVPGDVAAPAVASAGAPSTLSSPVGNPTARPATGPLAAMATPPKPPLRNSAPPAVPVAASVLASARSPAGLETASAAPVRALPIPARPLPARPVQAAPVGTDAVHLPDIRRLLAGTPPAPPARAQPWSRPVAVPAAHLATAPLTARPAVARAGAVHATTVAMRRPPAVHAMPAVSMLGMAWAAPGHDTTPPGGNR